MSLRSESVLFLLGAGASVDAGLKSSNDMISEVEQLIEKDSDWKKFKELYYCVTSGIYFKHGLAGNINMTINIENLVDTLNELDERHAHTLSPFIGSWIPKLAEINYELIGQFKKQILNKLINKWVALANKTTADYYSRLQNFSDEYGHRLDIFSLNYDRCIEESIAGSILERGFNSQRQWDHTRYREGNPDNANKKIYLYKMHGSIDWKSVRGKISEIDSSVNPEECKIIFGTTDKLQYIDPFLYFVNQFREKLLDTAEILVVVGYSYSDEYINTIIAQALKSNNNLKILDITHDDSERLRNLQGLLDFYQKYPELANIKLAESGVADDEIKTFSDLQKKMLSDIEETKTDRRQEIAKKLGIGHANRKKILLEFCSAKDFFEDKLSVLYLKQKFGLDDPF